MTQTTHFEKKFGREPFKAIKQGIFLALLIGGLFLFSKKADALFSDDFENYNLGNLNSQFDWIDEGDRWQVVGDKTHNGIKAIKITARPPVFRNLAIH